MKRVLLSSCCSLGLLALLAVLPMWGQAQGTTSPPTQPGGSLPSIGGQPRSTRPPGRPLGQMQGPTFVSGRIVMETGRPVLESVSIELNCGMRPLQVIHTDLGGYFTFSLGTGLQSNIDFSASNDTPISVGTSPGNLPRGASGSLTGCELRLSVPGYHPLNYTIAQHVDMGRIDVGTLRLRRIAGVEGSAISVTSLLVPKDARKEFEKAVKDIRNNRTESARQHLEKALATYDQYAAAWNELGRIYLAGGEKEKANQAFEKAIGTDPQYVQPYMNLAFLQLQDQQWQSAVETAGKILELDPSIGLASFLQAVGNFNLNQLDAAEKSAREAEKGPHENIPQVHALLAEILVQKRAYPNAAAEMRTYLQEAPQGQFAEQMKKGLEQIEKLAGSASNESSRPAEPTP